jgi:hypothetical protein
VSSLAEMVLQRRRARGTVTERGWEQLWSRVFDDGTPLGKAYDVQAQMVRMVPSRPAITLIAVGAWPMRYLYRGAAFAVIDVVPFVIPPVRGPETSVFLERVRAYDVPLLDDPDWQHELQRRYRRAAGIDTLSPIVEASSVPSIDLGPAILSALPDEECMRVLEWLTRMTGVGEWGVPEAELTPGLDDARAALPSLPRDVEMWEGKPGMVACVRLDHELPGQAGGQRIELAALRLARSPSGTWRFTRTIVGEHEREGQALS